jgi:hypothetical protein
MSPHGNVRFDEWEEIMTTPEARLTEIQTAIADERARLERGDDGRLESLAPLLDEFTRTATIVEEQGIVLNEQDWQHAEARRNYVQYQLSRCDTHDKLQALIDQARKQRDTVQLFLIAESLPPKSAARTIAERPLVDTKALREQLRGNAARIRDLRFIDPEKRRENWELRQQLQPVTRDDLVERKQALDVYGF